MLKGRGLKKQKHLAAAHLSASNKIRNAVSAVSSGHVYSSLSLSSFFLSVFLFTCISRPGMEHGVGVGDKLQLPVQGRQERTGEGHVVLTFSSNDHLVNNGGEVEHPHGCCQIHLFRGKIRHHRKD